MTNTDVSSNAYVIENLLYALFCPDAVVRYYIVEILLKKY